MQISILNSIPTNHLQTLRKDSLDGGGDGKESRVELQNCSIQDSENILDYDNEMKAVKLKQKRLRQHQDSGKRQPDAKRKRNVLRKMKKESNNANNSSFNLENTTNGRMVKKTVSNMEPLKEGSLFANMNGIEPPISVQKKFDWMLDVTESNMEMVRTSLTGNPVHENGENRLKKRSISTSQTSENETRDVLERDNLQVSTIKVKSNRGRKKKEQKKQNNENAIISMQNSLALNYLPESSKRSFEKSSQAWDASLSQEKPHRPRGRPRKHPLPQNEEKPAYQIIHTNTPLTTAQPNPLQKNSSNPKPVVSQIEIPQRTVAIPEYPHLNVQYPKLTTNFPNPIGNPPIQRNENRLSFLKECQSYGFLQREESGSYGESNPLADELFGLDHLQQIFGLEIPLRRRYSSFELSQHPINMLNEEDEEEKGQQHNDIGLEDNERGHDFDSELKIRIDIKTSQSTMESIPIPSNAGDGIVRRKRGRPRKHSLPNAMNAQQASVSTLPENDSKTSKSPNKNPYNETKISEFEYHSGEPKESISDSKDLLNQIQKRINKVEFVRNQLPDFGDTVCLQKTIIHENITTVELSTLQTIDP